MAFFQFYWNLTKYPTLRNTQDLWNKKESLQAIPFICLINVRPKPLTHAIAQTWIRTYVLKCIKTQSVGY